MQKYLNSYLPRDKVFISGVKEYGHVVAVLISYSGVEYKVKYYKEEMGYEAYFYDFELSPVKEEVNAN